MRRSKPYLLFVIIWIIFSYPFFIQGKVPAPLDFLVNFYTPWDASYDFPVKNPALSDVVNQMIPWKTFTAWSWKQGIVPLWNPFNFAGTPHLANWQSAVLYPTNLLFLVLPFTTAWSLHILLQPLLAGLFTIAFLRSLSLSRTSSLLGAVAFAFGGFMTVWLEWGTLGHAILWLPLALFAAEKYVATKNLSYILLWILSVAMSLLAGHLQVSLYMFVGAVVYFWYRHRQLDRPSRTSLFVRFLLPTVPFLLIAAQLLPSIDLFFRSSRSIAADPEWFRAFRIPLSGLLTFIAPDFFGNPVTRNHWSDHSYVEMTGYVGIIPLLLASITLITKKKRYPVALFWWFIGISLLVSLKTPVANALPWLRIPVLATSSPARIIGIISFALAVLAAHGLDQLGERIKKGQWRVFIQPVVAVMLVLAGSWLWTLTTANPNAQVSGRNLIVPIALTVGAVVIFIGSLKLHNGSLRRLSFLLPSSFILLTFLDLFRFHHKFTPYASADYFYPTAPVVSFLQANSGRVFGLFDANLNLPFRIPSIEGYDPLLLAEYVELTAEKQQGETGVKRVSSVQLVKSSRRTMNLLSDLGVKYVVQPTVHGAASWELRLWEYPDQFRKVYEDGQYQVFENLLTGSPQEPYVSVYQTHRRLFLFGAAISSVTLLGMLVILKTAPKVIGTST